VAGRRTEGWEGWDEYAPFYDWENARTLGRRDVAFWTQVSSRVHGRVLELGCGTGRITVPLAAAKVPIVGIDRSPSMLGRLSRREAQRLRRSRSTHRLEAVRGDIRSLPFRSASFDAVIAPYGVLQSLLRDRDLQATLDATVRVLRRGGLFGLDLVPDVPRWKEYANRVQLRGPAAGGAYLTLVESVRQDRRRRLTTFQQEFRLRRGRVQTIHPFTLTFRTVSIRAMIKRLERTGFVVRALLGDYRGRGWHDEADVWIVLAEKV
jgi:SAM-dependent methyltransferase